MFFKQKKPKAGEFDYEVARIQRMLDFVQETGKPLKAPSVEAIICNDCVVILDIKDDAGEKVSMCVVKDFRTKLNSKGMRFPVGQHAIVCKDAVVILSVTEEGLGVNLVNNRLDMDYELGISNEAVEAFMALEEVRELGE